MNNKMRRADRQLINEETIKLFRDAEYGVLSIIDENNMPYGVPMSFALCDNNIYFRCSAAGETYGYEFLRHICLPSVTEKKS